MRSLCKRGCTHTKQAEVDAARAPDGQVDEAIQTPLELRGDFEFTKKQTTAQTRRLFSDRVSEEGNKIGRVRPFVCFHSNF